MTTRRKDYAIETYLKKHSTEAAPLYEWYMIHRHRLEPIYSFWGEGFPSGNDHGWGHIERVLEKLSSLLEDGAMRKLSVRELYLAMVAILYHDWGILRQRKDHAELGAKLLEAEREFDAFTEAERDIVVAAIASHTSKSEIEIQTQGLPSEMTLAGDAVRPRVIAALIRLADELDEDSRRAPERAAVIKELGPAAQFYWRFCQCITGIQPKPATKEIRFNVRFTAVDLLRVIEVNGFARSFISAFGEKVEKINNERQTVNRFLPKDLAFDRITVTVSAVKGIRSMDRPRTVILDDHATRGEVVRTLPELSNHLYLSTLSKALQMALDKDYGTARMTLLALESIERDMPDDILLRVRYDAACFASRLAERTQGKERETYVREALRYLSDWLTLGLSGAWEANAQPAENELHRMGRDSDLHFLVFEERDDLMRLLPTAYHAVLPPEKLKAAYGGGGGCILRGTSVLTPAGFTPVEELREGDVILSFESLSGSLPRLLPVRLIRVQTHRSNEAIRLNEKLLISRKQPIQKADGTWTCAGRLRLGCRIVALDQDKCIIRSIRQEHGYFEFFDLSTESRPHTFVCDNIVCHNKMMAPAPYI